MVLAEKQKLQPYHNRKMGKALPLNDADIFYLGGRTIEVKSIPVHTVLRHPKQ